jgi:hypothetical protein
MDVAPPPSAGSRIEELGDTLVVRFRPRRSWGEIVFLCFWLVFWTFGGIAAMYALGSAGWGGRAFLLFWLCGWAVGEATAATAIAWQLKGRELLLVTPNQVEARKEIGRFARSRRMHLLTVDAVRAERVPSSEDDETRDDYRLKIVSRDETLYVGEGMGLHEAESVASVVMSHVRPPARWSDEDAEFGFAPPPPVPAVDEPLPRGSPPPRRRLDRQWILSRIVPVLFGAIVIGAVALFVLRPLRSPPVGPPVAPPPPPVAARPAAPLGSGPPSRADYADPREYASATTRYALVSARTIVHSTPKCGEKVTWTSWTCRARATSKLGPFAGRRLVYRCIVAYQRQPIGPAARTIECGPEHPPPITP